MHNYRVSCRIRPSHDAPLTVQAVSDEQVHVSDNSDLKMNRVFSQEASQECVYAEMRYTLEPAHQYGRKAAVFCYGQPQGGKTYSMFGPCLDDDILMGDERGIAPRALEEFFSVTPEGLKLSFVQVYNDKIMDMLAGGRTVTLHETNDATVVRGLKVVSCSSLTDALYWLSVGMKRQIRDSHSVLLVEFPNGGKVCFCDLAGFHPRSGSSRPQDVKSVDASVTSLATCISALRKRRSPPIKESKLTRLLRDYFVGDALLSLLVCVDPSSSVREETLRTLTAASRAQILESRTRRVESGTRSTKCGDGVTQSKRGISERMRGLEDELIRRKMQNLEAELLREKAERRQLEELLQPKTQVTQVHRQPQFGTFRLQAPVLQDPRGVPHRQDPCGASGQTLVGNVTRSSGSHICPARIGLPQPVQWGPKKVMKGPRRSELPAAIAEAANRLLNSSQGLHSVPSVPALQQLRMCPSAPTLQGLHACPSAPSMQTAPMQAPSSVQATPHYPAEPYTQDTPPFPPSEYTADTPPFPPAEQMQPPAPQPQLGLRQSPSVPILRVKPACLTAPTLSVPACRSPPAPRPAPACLSPPRPLPTCIPFPPRSAPAKIVRTNTGSTACSRAPYAPETHSSTSKGWSDRSDSRCQVISAARPVGVY